MTVTASADAMLPVGNTPAPTDDELLDLSAFEQWAREVRGLHPNTVRFYTEVCTNLWMRLGKPLRLADTEDLLAWAASLRGRCSPSTQRAYVSRMKVVYQWMFSAGLVASDPSRAVPTPRARQLQPIGEYYLSIAMEAAGRKTRVILALAAYAGLSAQEIADLSWDALRHARDGAVYLDVDRRSIEVGTALMAVLDAHGIGRHGPVLTSPNGCPIEAKSVPMTVSRFLRSLGIDATMRSLRDRYIQRSLPMQKRQAVQAAVVEPVLRQRQDEAADLPHRPTVNDLGLLRPRSGR